MQKYRLKDFEFSINPNTWNTAQDLAQSGAVRALREVEKNFWVASVDAPEGSWEVEIMITPQKIKAYTCECWSESRRLMCPHIAAALLKIRQFLERRQEERQVQKERRQSKETNRLTVQHVLEDVPHAELAEFVKTYARRDRDFALALKTWFAGQVKGPQNPYQLILESAISSAPMRANELRRLRKTLDDLLLQLESAAKDGNLPRVAQIATAIIEKIGPLNMKSPDRSEADLLHYCHAAFKTIQQTPWQTGSPEWQDALWHTICRWAESSWLPQALNADIIGVLYKHARQASRFEDIEQLFDRAPSPVPDRLLQLYVAALAERQMPEAAIRVLERCTDQPGVLLDSIRLLQSLHLDQAALLSAEYFLEREHFKLATKRELEDRILQLAERLSDRPMLLRWLRRRFIETGSTESFHKLKKLAAEDWKDMLPQLMQELQERGDHRKLAALFAAEKEYLALESLLENCTDTSLLDHYAATLSDTFLHKRYTQMLLDYLQDHFGKPAAMHVRQTLGGLLKAGKNALVRQIIQELTEYFPDRPSLPEELAELFPGTKKILL